MICETFWWNDEKTYCVFVFRKRGKECDSNDSSGVLLVFVCVGFLMCASAGGVLMFEVVESISVTLLRRY